MGQMAFPGLITGGDPNYFATWDDPPSTRCVKEPSIFVPKISCGAPNHGNLRVFSEGPRKGVIISY